MNEHKKAPFGHTFATNGSWYVYDGNTNGILAVEPEMAAVLPLIGTLDDDEIVARLAGPDAAATAPAGQADPGAHGTMGHPAGFEPERVREALEAVRRGQAEDGLFLPLSARLIPPDPATAARGACDAGLMHLVLTVTEQCNLRCTYCMHTTDLGWVRTHGTEAMSVETALQAVTYFLDRATGDPPPAISFYGGEALLEPRLLAAVMGHAHAHPRGEDVMFAVDTNGALLNDEVVDLLVRHRAHLQISLDGPAAQHDRCRLDGAGHGTHAAVLAGVDRLLRADRSAAARLSFIVTLAPPADLFAVAAFFARFPPFRAHDIAEAPQVRVNLANLRGIDWKDKEEGFRDLNAQVEVARDRYVQAVAEGARDTLDPVVRSLFDSDVIQFHHRSRAPLGDTFTPGGNCAPGRRKLHVMPDGSFHPCERTGGNLVLGDLAGGIRPSGVRALQENFHEAVQGRCGSCWALRMCGVCYAVQAEFSQDPAAGFPIPEEVCQSVRDSKEKILEMSARLLELPPERLAWLDDTAVV